MPRAAVLSLHARVEGTRSRDWANPAFVQVWGPRYSAYVVAAEDRAVFTLGRLPDRPAGRRRAEEIASRLIDVVEDGEMALGEAARALGRSTNALRYATATGRVIIRWDGARRPTIRVVPAPEIGPDEARLELLRRYLHVFGPGTPESFAGWAGMPLNSGRDAVAALDGQLIPVTVPTGNGWILADDEESFAATPGPVAPARLLPSGDAYYLLQGDDRRLLVSDESRRSLLWTPRVWPGALLVEGEVAGTWRRAGADVALSPWRRLTRAQRSEVEAEASSLPIPDVEAPLAVTWED